MMKTHSTRLRTFFALTGGVILTILSQATAATYYWDSNSTTSGFGSTAGTWGTSTFWSANSAGTAATANTTILAADDINFGTASAGYTGVVTISGTQTANSITIGSASGAVTLSGGTAFNLGNANTVITQNSVSDTTISTAIGGGTNGLTKSGSGRLILTNTANTYTGNTVVSGGILRFGSTWSNSWTSGSLNNNSNLEINGGIVEAYYQMTRTLGTGAGQIQFAGGRSGLTNLQGDASSAFMTFTNASTTVTWGSAAFNPTTLVLNDTGAQSTMRWVNPFDLNGAARTIEVSATGAGGGRGTYGTMEGNLSGTGASLIKTGVGTLMLNGTNSYDGGTTINNGGLWFHRLVAMPNAGAVTVNDGTILGITVGTSGWTNGASGNGTIGGLLSGLGGQSGGTVSYVGNVNVGFYLTANTTYAGILADVGTTLGIHVGNKDAGTGSDPFTASSTLTLSNSNTYTGGTTINRGQLTLGHATDTLANTGAINVNGGTLALGTNSDTVGAVTLTSGTISGTTGVLTGSSYTASSGTISAILGGTGVALTKNTAATLVLSGNNTFTGGVTLNAGRLELDTDAQVVGLGTFTINAGTIGALNNYQVSSIANDQIWNGNFSVDRAAVGSGSFTFSGDITLGNSVTASAIRGHSLIVSGVIDDGASNFSLTTSSGPVTLSGANTYNGGTILSSGTLNINNSGSGGTSSAIGTGTLTIAGGTIDNTSGNTVTLSTNNVQAWNGNFIFTGTNSLNMGSGAVTINANRIVTVSANTLTVDGIIGQSGGARTFTKTGTGTLVLGGANTFTGAITIDQGVLSVNNLKNYSAASSLGQQASGDILIGTTNTSTLLYTGTGDSTNRTIRIGNNTNTTSIAGATIANDGASGALVFTAANFNSTNNAYTVNRVLTLRGSNTGNNQIQGVIKNDSTSTGTISLTKTGVGTWALTNTNTYSGATNINQGILSVGTVATPTGSINNSAVTISGGNFRYNSSTAYTGALTFTSGAISGTNWTSSLSDLTIGANQTVSPGNSPGTASTGGQTWAAGGTYVWEINNVTGTQGADPGWDLINGTGTLDITAGTGTEFIIDITSLTLGNVAGDAANFNQLLSYNWLIADFATITGFDATDFTVDATGFTNAYTGIFGVSLGGVGVVPGDASQIYVTYTAIPEPKAALLGCLGVLLLLRRRR